MPMNNTRMQGLIDFRDEQGGYWFAGVIEARTVRLRPEFMQGLVFTSEEEIRRWVRAVCKPGERNILFGGYSNLEAALRKIRLMNKGTQPKKIRRRAH